MITNITAVADLVVNREDAEYLVRELTNRFALDTPERDENAPDIMEVHALLRGHAAHALHAEESLNLIGFLGNLQNVLPQAAISTGYVTSQECVEALMDAVESPGWTVQIMGKVMRNREKVEACIKRPGSDTVFPSAVEAWEWVKTVKRRAGFDAVLTYQNPNDHSAKLVIRQALS